MELPDYIDPEALQGFIEARKAMGKRHALNTDRQYTLLMNKLERFHNQGYDVNAMLDEAAEMGWKTIYPKDIHKSAGMTRQEIKDKVGEKLRELSDRSWAE